MSAVEAETLLVPKEILEEIGIHATIAHRQPQDQWTVEACPRNLRKIPKAVLIHLAIWHHAGLGGTAGG